MSHAGPTPHLSWDELACRDAARTPYPAAWRTTRAIVLGTEFERVRAAVGAAIAVASAYRTPAHNTHVGGARASQHVQGRALDLLPPRGWSMERFYGVVRAVAARDESRIMGVGRYATFVHVDVRPARADGKLTVWQGSRAWAEAK